MRLKVLWIIRLDDQSFMIHMLSHITNHHEWDSITPYDQRIQRMIERSQHLKVDRSIESFSVFNRWSRNLQHSLWLVFSLRIVPPGKEFAIGGQQSNFYLPSGTVNGQVYVSWPFSQQFLILTVQRIHSYGRWDSFLIDQETEDSSPDCLLHGQSVGEKSPGKSSLML